MAVTLDRKKDRLFDFIQEQIRLSRLPASKTFITGICVIQFHVSARQVALLCRLSVMFSDEVKGMCYCTFVNFRLLLRVTKNYKS